MPLIFPPQSLAEYCHCLFILQWIYNIVFHRGQDNSAFLRAWLIEMYLLLMLEDSFFQLHYSLQSNNMHIFGLFSNLENHLSSSSHVGLFPILGHSKISYVVANLLKILIFIEIEFITIKLPLWGIQFIDLHSCWQFLIPEQVCCSKEEPSVHQQPLSVSLFL